MVKQAVELGGGAGGGTGNETGDGTGGVVVGGTGMEGGVLGKGDGTGDGVGGGTGGGYVVKQARDRGKRNRPRYIARPSSQPFVAKFRTYRP